MKLDQFTNRKNIGRNALLLVACFISLPLLLVTLKAVEKRKRRAEESPPETSLTEQTAEVKS